MFFKLSYHKFFLCFKEQCVTIYVVSNRKIRYKSNDREVRNMKKCKKCGCGVADNIDVCPNCGSIDLENDSSQSQGNS